MPNSQSKPPVFVPGKGFNALVKKIKDGKADFFREVKKLTARYYWSLGDDIHKHILQNKNRADYGMYLYPRLAKEIEIEESMLHRAVQFRQVYPILVGQQELSWDILRRLMIIRDKTERERITKLVIEQGWSGDKVQEYLNSRRVIARIKDTDAPIPQLKCERGTLYTYRIIERTTLDSPNGKFVDNGFHHWSAVKSAGKFQAGDIVECFKGARGGYSVKKTARALKDLYTFAATVEHIADGDTQWVIVDCGFSVWQKCELRFRGIDCPEIGTPEGQAAKKFVEERLRPCEFIVIKTYKTEKWGRYLADVFYRPSFVIARPEGSKQSFSEKWDPAKVAGEGIFLNQELLDNRLAVVWKG